MVSLPPYFYIIMSSNTVIVSPIASFSLGFFSMKSVFFSRALRDEGVEKGKKEGGRRPT